MYKVVNFLVQKEMVIWTSVLTGFHVVLKKSNLVPIKWVHDTFHNLTRSDVRYEDGVMVICVTWSKTNQFGEWDPPSPLIGDNNNPICPVRWILHMLDQVPMKGSHNLFSYIGKKRCNPHHVQGPHDVLETLAG